MRAARSRSLGQHNAVDGMPSNQNGFSGNESLSIGSGIELMRFPNDVIGKTEPILVLAPIVNHLFDSRRYGIVVPGVEGLAREFYSFRTHNQRDGIADRERAGRPR